MSSTSKAAESLIARQCYLGKAIPTEPSEDNNGWDFMVELPRPPLIGSYEEQPAHRLVFLQIKSTITKSRTVKIKLSNQQKACASREPWFLILVDKNDVVYGRHFDRALMSEALRKIRHHEISGHKLNLKEMSVTFYESDKITENLVSWMLRHIGSSAAEYSEQKLENFRHLGYDNGAGNISFTLRNNQRDLFEKVLLGAETGIQLDKLLMTNSRFGIDESKPDVFSDIVLEVSPIPTAHCIARIRGPIHEETRTTKGFVYAVKLDNTNEPTRMRIVAEPIQIMHDHNRVLVGKINLEPNIPYSLETFHLYATIVLWSRQGPVDLQIVAEGTQILRETLNLSGLTDDPSKTALVAIISLIKLIAVKADASNVSFTIEDINASFYDLSVAAAVHKDNFMKVESVDDTEHPQPSCIVYYWEIEFGDWIASAVVKRSVVQTIKADTKFSSICSKPVILEAQLHLKSEHYQYEAVEYRFRSLVDELSDIEIAMGIGDIIALSSEAKQSTPAI